MITDEMKYKISRALQNYTYASVKRMHTLSIPYFNKCDMYNVKKYYFEDKSVTYTLSDDEPEKTYGIIYVENMPYKSMAHRESQSNFTGRLDRMIFCNEVEPFLLFINGHLIPWDEITIIHSGKDSYIRINDIRYNYFTIKDIKMLVIPFNITYVGVESDYLFNLHLTAFRKYIEESGRLVDGKLRINIPTIKDDYYYDNIDVNVGMWMINQNRLRYLGLLPKDRFDRLRAVNVNYFEYNDAGEKINVFNTSFNIFDKDSYDRREYGEFLNVSQNTYLHNALFRFNEDGLLADDGDHIICAIDTSHLLIKRYISNGPIEDNLHEIENVLFPDNFIVFKNGSPIKDPDIAILGDRDFCIAETENITAYLFYNKKLRKVESNRYWFPNQNYYERQMDSYIRTKIPKWIEKQYNLDYQYVDEVLHEENDNTAYNCLIRFNPSIFNELYSYSKNIYSTVVTGDKVMQELDKSYGDFKRRGIKIPRSRREDHETYILVFINGELIDTYSDALYFPNFMFLPIHGELTENDTVEFLFFTNCNNNEYQFFYRGVRNIDPLEFVPYNTNNQAHEPNVENDRFYIKDLRLYSYNKENTQIEVEINGGLCTEELKIFSATPPKDLLVYPTIDYHFDHIAFPVSERKNGSVELIDKKVIDTTLYAVSSKKFVYERLYVDQKAYKIRLGKRFRFCDNQKQYELFINGRRMLNDTFLITIPKITRPFDDIYLYTRRFVNPEDRMELFYLPEELVNINEENDFVLNTNGYLSTDKTKLDVPLDSELFLFWINGKKIPKNYLIPIDMHTLRMTRDMNNTCPLIVNPIYKEYIPEIKNIINHESSKIDDIVSAIVEYDSTLAELNTLMDCHTLLTDIDDHTLNRNVAPIAIINEIVRDFWVTSGYDYQAHPFVYDYEKDDFITLDVNTNTYVSPAMDPYFDKNIIKENMHLLYFTTGIPIPDFFERGQIIENLTFTWEYNSPPYEDNPRVLTKQIFSGEEIDVSSRNYIERNPITSKCAFIVEGYTDTNYCQQDILINFANGVYYGLIDEDLLDHKESDIYSDHPADLIRALDTKLLQDHPEITLTDYVIGNNKYFVYAAPVQYDGENVSVSFHLPDITTEEFINANRDDKTIPIFTNGELDPETKNLVKLDKFQMELMTEFNFTNQYGYTEKYRIYKSNGFFTRLYEETKFSILVKSSH